MSQQVLIAAVDEDCFEWSLHLPDYNKNFVDDLKKEIPFDKRSWNPEERVWVVTGEWVHKAAAIAAKYVPQAEIVWTEP